MNRLVSYLTGRARKALVAELVVLATLGTALSDISPGGVHVTAAEWILIAITQAGAVGVHQIPNAPAPPAPAHLPVRVEHIIEADHGRPVRLGRHLEHDPRSLAYPVRARLDTAAPLVSRRWTRRSPIFDQGQVGSCVGNAAAGWYATDRIGVDGKPVRGRRRVTEHTALRIYTIATELDSIPGSWPYTDTGSTGLAGARALVEVGYATGYTHGFSLDDLLRTLSQVGPAMVGISWHRASFTPEADGRLRLTGPIDGGHEFAVDEIDVANQRVWIDNSWAAAWGVSGRAYFTWADLGAALAAGGDVTVPH